jgi:hypothetical protein
MPVRRVATESPTVPTWVHSAIVATTTAEDND